MSQNIIVVAHGKSELVMWQNLRMRLRLNICVYSRNNGEDTISISHLPELFTNGDLSSVRDIVSLFRRDLDYHPGKRDPLPGLRIFPVMDIDGNGRDRRPYITGELLRDVPLADHIVPIYNDDNLDEVMGQMGYTIDTGRPKAASYGEITRRMDIPEFYGRLLSNGNTNMD